MIVTAEEAMERIHDILYLSDEGAINTDKEWSPETTEAIAEVVNDYRRNAVEMNEGEDSEEEEEEGSYLNHYRHTDCPVQPGVEWDDTHSCMCNDRCPACDAEIEPYDSDDLDDEGKAQETTRS
jgi:hypothetical protein